MTGKYQFSPSIIRVLMVCLGNICRSPTARGILEKQINNNNLKSYIYVDSAGTGDWHIGESPDKRAVEAAAERGFQIANYRARQIYSSDFKDYDYILAMDYANLRDLKKQCPAAYKRKLQLLLDYGSGGHDTVPDPYYSGDKGFELVLDLLEESCTRLLQHIKERHSLGEYGR